MCCIRLQSRSKKITFVVRVMLYFVRKYPGTKVTLPVKTVRTIYGSAFGWKPSLLLKKLQWFSDKGAQPVFAVIKENQGTKATQCEVLFHPTVLTVVFRESSEVYQKGVQKGSLVEFPMWPKLRLIWQSAKCLVNWKAGRKEIWRRLSLRRYCWRKRRKAVQYRDMCGVARFAITPSRRFITERSAKLVC